MSSKQIYCCECKKEITARLTYGREIYSHRSDLYNLPFWICDICNNYVGCHHKTKDRTRPLGNIPNKEIKEARKHIHALLDPLWQNGDGDDNYRIRNKVYQHLSSELGYKFHTAEIKDIQEARRVYKIVQVYCRVSNQINLE